MFIKSSLRIAACAAISLSTLYYSATPAMATTMAGPSNQNMPISTAASFNGRAFNELITKGDARANQLIVKYRPESAPAIAGLSKTSIMPGALKDFSLDSIRNLYRPVNKLAARQAALLQWKVLTFSKGQDVVAAYEALRNDPQVEYVVPNIKHHIAAAPNDLHSNLWGLNNTGQDYIVPDSWGEGSQTYYGKAQADIKATQAWDIRHDASSVVVAVIDTGIDYTHSDLAPNMWTNPGETANGQDSDGNGYVDDIHGYNFTNDTSDPMDVFGHGSHCAGTIGARGNNGAGITGVAWNVKLMAVKVLDDSGSGYTDWIMNGILYAADMGAQISNNSWGARFNNELYADLIYRPIADAIQYANEAGMLFVAAAGNDAANVDGHATFMPSGVKLPNTISVAASTSKDQLAEFSNYGRKNVDIAAPGHHIYSTIPGNQYAFYSGTSMATPHVSGAAALLKAHNPDLTPAEIRSVLMNTVDVIESLPGQPGLDQVTLSQGRLNLKKALEAVSVQSCAEFTSSNSAHVSAGRAYTQTSGWWWTTTTTYYAQGSNENLGTLSTTTTTLYEVSPGVFSKTNSCSSTSNLPPIIKMNGSRYEYVELGAQWTDAGAIATDREQGDLTSAIVTEGSVNPLQEGLYLLNYTVTDNAGLTDTISRKVFVVTASAPVIYTVKGCNLMFGCEVTMLNPGDAFVDPGYFAMDFIDGDITSNVEVRGDILTQLDQPGVGFVTYHVTNSHGIESLGLKQNVLDGVRFVAVVDENTPLIWPKSPYNYFDTNNNVTTWKRAAESGENFYPDFFILDWIDDGYYFSDNNAIEITGTENVDLTTPGQYVVTYKATNSRGFSDTRQQVVTVVEDTEAPTLIVEGSESEPVVIEIGTFFFPDMLVKEVSDNLDPRAWFNYSTEQLTGEPAGYFHTDAVGTWRVSYDATDGAGNAAPTQYRTIQVVHNQSHAPFFVRFYAVNTLFEDAKIMISANDYDNDLTSIEIKIDDGQWIQVGTAANVDYEYLPQANMAGRYKIAGRAIDQAGHITEYHETVFWDVYARPELSTPQQAVSGRNATLTGTASDKDNFITRVQVVRNDTQETISCEGRTQWSCTINTLPLGTTELVVVAIDETNFESLPKTVLITIDESAPCFTTTNSGHRSAGRAYSKTSWWSSTYYANGSNDVLGTSGFTTTSLKESAAGSGHWNKVTSCP
jgi:subtilisin family serine protease